MSVPPSVRKAEPLALALTEVGKDAARSFGHHQQRRREVGSKCQLKLENSS
jgi:hypothetical protein